MPRVPAILGFLAVCGALLSATLAFRIRQAERKLAAADTHATQLASDLTAANENSAALKIRVTELDASLETARAKVAAGAMRISELDRDLAQTRSVFALYEETSRALATEVAMLRQDLADTRAASASPEAVAAYKNTIAELERQLASSRNGAAAPTAPGASTAVFTNRVRLATVLTVGPENAFVVLNFGAARGAQLGQKLSVSHGTNEVATVLISDVRPNFSIAQVLPDTLRAALQKGDSALLLR